MVGYWSALCPWSVIQILFGCQTHFPIKSNWYRLLILNWMFYSANFWGWFVVRYIPSLCKREGISSILSANCYSGPYCWPIVWAVLRALVISRRSGSGRYCKQIGLTSVMIVWPSRYKDFRKVITYNSASGDLLVGAIHTNASDGDVVMLTVCFAAGAVAQSANKKGAMTIPTITTAIHRLKHLRIISVAFLSLSSQARRNPESTHI